MSRASVHHHSAKKHRVMVVRRATKSHWVDRATYIIAIVEPATTLPQVYAIWSSHNATGVSVSSWVGYLVFGFVWLYYGIVHKDKAIIIYNSIYFVLEIIIIVGALHYGGHW